MRWMKIEEQLMTKAKKIADNLPPPMPEEIENFDINTGAGGGGREVARKFQLLLQKKILTYGRKTPVKYVGAIPGLPFKKQLETYGDVAGYITKLSTELGTL